MTRIARGGALLALVVLASLALAGPASADHRKRHGADARAAHALPKPWAKKFKARAAKADPDGDGLTNWGEWRAHTRPRRADSDRDGVADAAEDFDRDRLANGAEEDARTDPRRRDTDRDGTRDGAEDPDGDGLDNAGEALTEHLPRDPDTDGDGIRDGDENGGVVTAVGNGTATLALAAGGTLTAALDGGCEDGWDDAAPDEADDFGDDAGDDDEDLDDEDASTLVTASLAEEGDEDDPLDEEWEDGCEDLVEPGAVVHEAAVEDGVFVTLELL